MKTAEFKGTIDLRGCSYDRIQPIYIWEELLYRLDPYDRDPINQIEETYRRAGRDRLANSVYYKRKLLESTHITWLRPGPWMLDRVHWLLTGYGVKLWRLLVATVFLLLIGTFMFRVEGAVELKKYPELPTTFEKQVEFDHMLTPTFTEAFWVSLDLFLLSVDIPEASEWELSSENLWGIISFKLFAAVLRLWGWIFLSLVAAGLSGGLKR